MLKSNVKFITLVAMCCALFITNLDETIINVALPKIQTSLGSNVSGLQWILNAYTLALTSLALTSGILGDIYGRKRVFIVGLVIFTIASLLCGIAPNLGILIAGRTLQGVGGAALLTGSLSILTDTFPESEEKAKAIGIWTGVSGIALVAGPVVGGLLVDNFGWQSVFFFNLPFGVIGLALTCSVVKEVRNPKKQSIDWTGLLLSIVFLASLTYALTESHTEVWQLPLIVWLLALAGLSLVAFLVFESRSPHPMLPLNLFNNTTFAVANFVLVLLCFTFISFLFVFSLFLQQVQGYSAVAAGMRFLPLNAAFVIACIASGWFAARLGDRFTILMALTLASVTTFSFMRITADTEYGAILFPLVLSGFGGGLALATLSAIAINSAPSSEAGIVSAVVNTSPSLGNVLGIAIQGTILSHWLALDLARSLSAWNLPSTLQDRIIADALHNGSKVSSDILAHISPLAWHQAFSNAFISGLHLAVLVASIALLVGVFLIVVFVPSKFKKRSHF